MLKKETSSPVFITVIITLFNIQKGDKCLLQTTAVAGQFRFPFSYIVGFILLCSVSTVFKLVFAQQMSTTLFNRYVRGGRHSQLDWNLFCAISFCVWRFIYNLRIILFAFVLCNNHVLSLSYQCLDNVQYNFMTVNTFKKVMDANWSIMYVCTPQLYSRFKLILQSKGWKLIYSPF